MGVSTCACDGFSIDASIKGLDTGSGRGVVSKARCLSLSVFIGGGDLTGSLKDCIFG